MTTELSKSAKKVKNWLVERGHEFDVKELPDSTRTVQDAANAIGCTVSQIAKSLIFLDTASEEPILIIASGSNQVDLVKVESALGVTLGRADGKFVKKRTGFAIGGVPPVAHKHPVRTVLDVDLKQHAEIWAAAGTPNAVFALQPDNLDELTEGVWLSLA